MIGYLLAKIPRTLVAIPAVSGDLIGLLFLSIRRTSGLLSAQKRAIFWLLFKRQMVNIGFKSIYINGIIGLLLSWLVMSRAYALLPEGMQFSEYYAQFFVIVVIREIGPLFSGLILIARSANAITFEIGHLKLHNQFETLKAQGMDPVYVFLLPVLFAFPLSLMAMIIIFVLVCIFASFIFIQTSYQADLHLIEFVSMILAQISSLEVLISFLKCFVGGIFIGLLCIYFGARVQNKFTDISRAISSATSWQFLLFFAINIGLSVLGYL